MFRVGHDAIDAEQRVVFVMDGMLEAGIHDVEPAIEVADPQAAVVHGERGDIAIRHHGSAPA